MFSPETSLRDLAGLAAILVGGLLALIVALGALQTWVRRSQQDQPESGRGDWENTLAGYKNLRDQGVLSEEEYRKIRTLVEPHVQISDAGGVLPPAGPLPRKGNGG
ncbi:MAG: hypothetical protein RLZZ326_1178 [Planctomycetota bacterium]